MNTNTAFSTRSRATLTGFAWIAALAALACTGGEPAQTTADYEALDRELAVALEGDSASATFQDTAVTLPAAAPPPAQPAPARAPRQEAPRPVPAPPPAQVQPVEPAAPALPAAPREAVVRTGTLLRISLNEELSTEKNKVGDAFTATLVDAVAGENGEILVPAGATVRGRVVHVQQSGRVGETAVLNVAFEALSFSGASHPLDATVVQANPERVTRQSTGEQVGKVAVGAAAGAILGRVLGGKNKDAVKGAVVGAAAGTAIALGTADVDAVLKAGSLMVIQTDSPIRVVIAGGTPAP